MPRKYRISWINYYDHTPNGEEATCTHNSKHSFLTQLFSLLEQGKVVKVNKVKKGKEHEVPRYKTSYLDQ